MSHGGDEDDLAAQAWPGFVDILSSVLIMFVFFLMLTAVALAFHVALFKSKVKNEMAAVTAQRVEEQVQSAEAQLLAENKELKEKMAQSQSSPSQDHSAAAQLEAENKELKDKLIEAQAAIASAQEAAAQAQQQAVATKADHNEEAKRELETKLDATQQGAIMAESKDQTLTIRDSNNLVVFYGPDAISLTPDINAKITEFLGKFNPDAIKVTISATRNTSNAVEDVARRVAVARMLNLRNAVIAFKVPPAQIIGTIVEADKIDDKFDWVTLKVENK